MEDISKVILTFKDQQYPLTKVRAKGLSGPPVTVKAGDINFSAEALGLVELSADVAEFHGGSIIFYKYEGKYIVFGGRDQVSRDLAKGKIDITGHLLSGPALKGTRIQKFEPPAPAQIEALTNHFTSAHDRTRVEVRTRSSSYDKERSYPSRQTSGNTLHARSQNGSTRSGS